MFGIRLDLSAAAYCMLFPFLLILASLFIKGEIFNAINTWYHRILIFIINIICVSNIVIYKYWHTLLNKRALDFLYDPAEIFASLTTFQIVSLVIVYCILFIVFTWLFGKVAGKFDRDKNKSILRQSAGVLISFCLTFYFLRGGLQLIPINESSCYFSEKPEENHAAINPSWFIVRNLQLASRAGENPFLFYDDAIAEQKFTGMFQTSPDTGVNLFSIRNPNIVFLILESHTVDVIEALGGDSANSPQLDNIIRNDGFTFANCYASGFRTDQMLPSLFSGFPAQPSNSISRNDDKTGKLPHLPQLLKSKGYHTSFYYGGEMGFANMKSFLINSGVTKLTDQSAFSSDQLNSKWGAHDEYTLNYFLNDLNKMQQPFFASLLTLTLHEPFEIPANPKFEGNSENIKFKNAAFYADSCIGVFFERAKKQPWYANTIICLVADHGHQLPRQRPIFDPYIHKIPLIITGGSLKNEYRGKQHNRTMAQNDLPRIILEQLGYSADEFKFSKNTLNKNTQAFAYLCFDDGFTWVTDSCSVHYSRVDNKAQVVSGCNTANQSAINTENGKAFLQVLYQAFLDM